MKRTYSISSPTHPSPLLNTITNSQLLVVYLIVNFYIAGNIALHIMQPELRESYDLETLWTVGPQYDEKSQTSEESLVDIYKLSDPLAGLRASTEKYSTSD